MDSTLLFVQLSGASSYLQHAVAEALLAGPFTASTAVAGRPQVHSTHVAVDVQEQHPFYIIWQSQWLTITDDLPQQADMCNTTWQALTVVLATCCSLASLESVFCNVEARSNTTQVELDRSIH